MLYRQSTSQIVQDLSIFPVVGIIGPRQVGKTTLAKQLVSTMEVASNIKGHYLDLELASDRRKLLDAEAYLKMHQDKCIVIDEIQCMPELFALIRALVDIERRPARFILLGSASPEVIKGASESLAGRIAYTELTPFSLPEVVASETMHRHWLTGGFPPALLAASVSDASRWLGAFIDTLVHRDLQELGHQLSPVLVERMLTMIASYHGGVLNISDLGRSLGVSSPTVTRYLDILEAAFIVHRLPPYYMNTTKRIVKQPKIYIRDSGVLHHLLGIRTLEQLLGHAAVGASWEGYVIEQIKRVALGGVKLFFYRTHAGAETDVLMLFPDGQKWSVEIKRSQNQPVAKGFHETIKDVMPARSFVVVPETERYTDRSGVTMTGLEAFLSDEMSQRNTN